MKPSMTTAVALVAALSAVPARSEETSREQVRAEAASAAKAGEIGRGEAVNVPVPPSTKPRADVKAETRAAVKSRAIDHGEVTSVPPVASSGKTRAEVKAEAASAIQATPPRKPDAAASAR